jgi:hypothetical protein
MTTAGPTRRPRPTPDRCVLLLLLVEALLFLSNWLGWPAWHKGYAAVACVAVVGLGMLTIGLWWAVALIFRRRFQFSIRSLHVLVVAIAVPCSWLAVEAKDERDAIATIDKYGGTASRVSLLPKAISEPLCLDNCRYFDRVNGLRLPSPRRSSRDDLIPALKKLRHLKCIVIERSILDFMDLPELPDRGTLLETAEISAAIADVGVSEWIY